jgi:hypothetical protein
MPGLVAADIEAPWARLAIPDRPADVLLQGIGQAGHGEAVRRLREDMRRNQQIAERMREAAGLPPARPEFGWIDVDNGEEGGIG